MANLYIKNYALIDELDINFCKGFTTITGETGAGKSILLGGLSLVLGRRADLTMLKDKTKKCIVEAQFCIESYNLKSFFEESNLDYAPNTLIRREILPEGSKSRAFINDTPVTLNVLNNFTKQLLNIHSQDDTSQVGNVEYHFYTLDLVADNVSLLKKYRDNYHNYKRESQKLKDLISRQEDLQQSYDYNVFSLKEIQDLDLKEGLQSSLEKDLKLFSNTEQVHEQMSLIIRHFSDDQVGVLSSINQIASSLSKLSAFGNKYDEISKRISSVAIELEDIFQEVASLEENIDLQPQQLNQISQKLERIYDLQRKHRVDYEADLIRVKEDLESKVQLAEFANEDITRQKQILEQLEGSLHKLAQQLHQRRLNAIPSLVSPLEKSLSGLGMPHAKLQIKLEFGGAFLENGKDNISFLFSANKNTSFGEIKKVASGGERSRIMLSIKHILSAYVSLPSIIFDEIDTGVSGQIAIKTAEMMYQMSKNMQVIAITHLPQVAAQGNTHLKVSKIYLKEKTMTDIKILNDKNRILEIAEMLSGKNPPKSAIRHASELLK